MLEDFRWLSPRLTKTHHFTKLQPNQGIASSIMGLLTYEPDGLNPVVRLTISIKTVPRKSVQRAKQSQSSNAKALH